jgi:hypothetical protein
MTLVSFSPLRIEDTYQDWRERLAKANNPRFIPIDHIDQRLADGTAYFFGSAEAAMVAELTQYPGGAKVVSVIAAAGDMDFILGPLGDHVMAWGKDHGADMAMVPGREGWRRKRPDFQHYQTILVKEL